MTTATPGGRSRAPTRDEIVGREPELDRLAGFLDGVADGPSGLLLRGEAGIGKTTIWRAGVVEARERQFRTIACAPGEFETGLAFAALADLLEPVLDEALPELPEVQRHALEVALLRAAPGRAPLDPRAVSTATLGVLRHLARGSAVIVAIDDVQWLDSASAGALQFALRRLEVEPVGLLQTVRAGTAAARSLGLCPSVPRDRLELVEIGPLDLEQIERLLRPRLAEPFLRPTLLRVHRACAGNPFYAIEIARTLSQLTRPLTPGEPLPVPESLQDVIHSRLSGLPATVRETLLAAAGLSEPTLELLEEALGEVAGRRLARAADADVVRIGDGRVRFAHPLLAAAVYSSTPPARRRRMHRRLAATVKNAEERARHLGLAASGPDVKAAAALDRGARLALARGAPDVAAELAEQALRLTPLRESGEARRRALDAADCHLRAGDTARARELLEQTARSAPAGDTHARALHGLARVRGREQSHDAARALLERALSEACDPVLRAAIDIDLIATIFQSGDLRVAVGHVEDAVTAAESGRHPALLAQALSYAAMLELLIGGRLRTDLLERAVASAGSSDPSGVSRLLPPELAWGTLLKWVDDFEGARTKLTELRDRALGVGEDGWMAYIWFQLGELECWAGDLSAAARCAEAGRRAARQTGSPAAGVLSLYVEALVAAHAGELDTARSAATQGAEIAARSADLRSEIRCLGVLGLVELSRANADRAVGHLVRAGGLARAAGYRNPAVLRVAADEIEALIAVGRLEQAEDLATALETSGRALDSPWSLATGGRCRGMLAAARGDLVAAVAALELALAHHDRLPQPFEFARTLLALGVVERRRKRKRAARERLDESLEVFERLGARVWAERVRGELARVGGRAPSSDAVTPTEERVITLVAQGYTNREVARQLFMSAKTVEAHLGRVYRKLGVRSRRELARRVRAEAPSER